MPWPHNVIGSVNVINAAVSHGARVFVFALSIAVYGSSPVVGSFEK